MAQSEQGRGTNWQALAVAISGGTLISIAIAAFWSILQTQLNGVQHQIDSQRRDFERSDRNLAHDLERREIEIKARIDKIEGELSVRRGEFVGQSQYKEFHESVERYMSLPYVTEKQWNSWREERDKAIATMQQRMDRLERQTVK